MKDTPASNGTLLGGSSAETVAPWGAARWSQGTRQFCGAKNRCSPHPESVPRLRPCARSSTWIGEPQQRRRQWGSIRSAYAAPQPWASRIQTPQPKPQPVPGGQPDGSDGSLTRGCLGPTDVMAKPDQPTRWGLIASSEGGIEVLAAAAEAAKFTLRLTGVLVCTGYDGDARRDHLSDQTPRPTGRG